MYEAAFFPLEISSDLRLEAMERVKNEERLLRDGGSMEDGSFEKSGRSGGSCTV